MISEKKYSCTFFFTKNSNVKIKIMEFQQFGFKMLHLILLILFVLEMFCVCGRNGTGITPQIWSSARL